jgi:hypothetical protein
MREEEGTSKEEHVGVDGFSLDGIDGFFFDGRIGRRDARKRVLSLMAATEPNNRLSKSTVTQGLDGRPGMIQ